MDIQAVRNKILANIGEELVHAFRTYNDTAKLVEALSEDETVSTKILALLDVLDAIDEQ